MNRFSMIEGLEGRQLFATTVTVPVAPTKPPVPPVIVPIAKPIATYVGQVKDAAGKVLPFKLDLLTDASGKATARVSGPKGPVDVSGTDTNSVYTLTSKDGNVTVTGTISADKSTFTGSIVVKTTTGTTTTALALNKLVAPVVTTFKTTITDGTTTVDAIVTITKTADGKTTVRITPAPPKPTTATTTTTSATTKPTPPPPPVEFKDVTVSGGTLSATLVQGTKTTTLNLTIAADGKSVTGKLVVKDTATTTTTTKTLAGTLVTPPATVTK